MLGHLSKESNFPELAYKTVAEELMHNDNNSVRLAVANRFEASPMFDIG